MPDLLFFLSRVANPDLMIKWLVPGEKGVAILDGSLQCFSLSTIDAVSESFHYDRPFTLQCDDPCVVSLGVEIHARDVTRRVFGGRGRS